MPTCPLCAHSNCDTNIEGADQRTYLLCKNCKLIFTDSKYRPSLIEEEARYKLHDNGIEFQGYVDFLNQAIQPSLNYLKPQMKGIDYGCGPNPTLSILLERSGFTCDDYDPIFFPQGVKSKDYDYVFSTECFEHFFNPEKDLLYITKLLKKSGLLIVMTLLWKNVDEFSTWFYTKDPTHVSFYHAETFNLICRQFGYKLLWTDHTRIFILQKN